MVNFLFINTLGKYYFAQRQNPGRFAKHNPETGFFTGEGCRYNATIFLCILAPPAYLSVSYPLNIPKKANLF